jgi:hypothetical protein
MGLEGCMRGLWIGAAVAVTFAATLAMTAAGMALAQQTPAQPSIADPDQADQTTTPPAKPPRHARKAAASSTVQSDPDLDANDQLAPSQMKQPMPAAVSQPSGAAHPMKHAATDTPAAPAAPAAAPMAPRAPRAPAADARTVACVGAFSKDSSHLRLAMTYDSKNVAFADVSADGGTKVQASVLFPNDPKRRLEVWWANPAARSQTYLIVINGQSTWSGPGGMKLGLTLAQLEKLNHKPFKVKGFNKDGVATVSDWDGGLLSNLAGGCKSGLSLRADPKVPADTISALTDDKEFSSSDAAIRAAKPAVSEVLIGY